MCRVSTRRTRISETPALPAHPLPAGHVVVEIKADPARAGGRLVLQDGVESSYIDVLDPTHLEFEYLRHLARVLDVTHPKRLPMTMAQIGGGPCALARYLDATRRELHATIVERDAEIVAIAREWLGLRTSPRLQVLVGDGRTTIATLADHSLDVLVVDAFDGVVVPHDLTTVEFVAEARRVLRQGGLHLVNLIDLPPLAYAAAAAATLRETYANVAVLADAATLDKQTSGNLVLVGSDRDLSVDLLTRLARRDPAPWEVVAGRRLDRFAADAVPLSDGVAPDHPLAIFGPLWGRASDIRARIEARS